MKEIKFVRFSAKVDSAGYDLFYAENCVVEARSVYAVNTDVGIQNVYVKLVGKVHSSSSMSMRQIEAGAGVFDSGYRGVIYVVLHNHSDKDFEINVGDGIAQIVFEKISIPVLTKILSFSDHTERRVRGFGSSRN